MALDWIKVGKDTPDKPKIAILARKLETDHADAFLQWFRVYSWADGVTADGNVPFLSLEDGDRLSRAKPGTIAALASAEIEWVRDYGGGFRFLNWERHNGENAKKRAKEAEKKRKQRQCGKLTGDKCPQTPGTNVPDDTGQKQGLEKRREDIKENTKRKDGFIKPTVDEVRAYCLERKNNIDPEAFVNFYETNGWVQGRDSKPIKCWKACVRTWETNGIRRGPTALPTTATFEREEQFV